MRNLKDNKYIIIGIIVASLISIGIAFATFSTTLNINGNATVDASNWEIVFEGLTTDSILDNPSLTGTATEVTHPTIKNNATEISNYSVSLMTPGDSVSYNFKIHNKGTFDAEVSSLIIAGITNPTTAVSGGALVTDSTIAAQNVNTLAAIEYKFYYTDNNVLVGQDEEKDCLAPGEEENVTLRIVFSSVDETDTSVLPNTNLVLNNLGVSLIYNQGNTCSPDSGGGGGGGEESDTSAPGTVETPVGRGTGVPVSAPTLDGDELDDAAGSVSAAGDSIEFPILVTPEDDAQVTATIPTLQDLIAANPSIDPNILEDIEITVVNADTGEPISDVKQTCIEKDVPVRIKMVLKYKDVPTKSTLTQATTVNVPTTKLTYKKVLTCTITNPTTYNNTGQYILAGGWYTYTFEDGNAVYTSNLSDIAFDYFYKNINGRAYPCIKNNGNVYCLTDNENEATLTSLCSTLGGTYSHVTDEGSTHDEVISSCSNPNGVGFDYNYVTGCEHYGPHYRFYSGSNYSDYFEIYGGQKAGSYQCENNDINYARYIYYSFDDINKACNITAYKYKYLYWGYQNTISDFCAEHAN